MVFAEAKTRAVGSPRGGSAKPHEMKLPEPVQNDKTEVTNKNQNCSISKTLNKVDLELLSSVSMMGISVANMPEADRIATRGW